MTSVLSKPVRKLRPNRSRSVIYQFPSAKNSRPLKVEEWIELHFCYLMEYDKSVLSYRPQPIRFFTTENDRPRSYVPDFEVTYENRAGPTFIECKPQNQIEKYHKKRQLFLPQIEALGGHLEVSSRGFSWTGTLG